MNDVDDSYRIESIVSFFFIVVFSSILSRLIVLFCSYELVLVLLSQVK